MSNKEKTGNKLTPKLKLFVDEYLLDLNATQAWIRAGFAKKSASVESCKCLAKPKIQAAIQKALDRRAKRTEITQDRVIQELALIGFSDMKNYVDFGPSGVSLKELSEMPPEISRVISEVSHNFNAEGGGSVKFKLYDKQTALVNIGKHLGMFVDKSSLDVAFKVLIGEKDAGLL